ncbi:MAG: YceI family protein [Myxococcales bacterium]|jgi:polyisoprenoid-binding protein YceI
MPRTIPVTLLAAAFALLAAPPALAQEKPWSLDPNHSHIGFTARHLAFAKVRGEFTQFSAEVKADRETGRITELRAVAKAASVDTGNAKRDKHLRSPDFFDAKNHPEIRLKMETIRWKGNDFTATVALTMRGVTKKVKFEGELLGIRTVDFGNGPHRRAAYEARAEIDRHDFGLNFNGLAEGISIVGDKVEIDLEVELSTK